MNRDIWGVPRGAVESVDVPAGKRLRTGELTIFTAQRFAPRFLSVFLVFVELRGESGVRSACPRNP
ncbi:hypothetical protein [Burkholderia sp. Ed8]|uniref:hypothetical protein n=1 Tax=Burkholderia sp. Ed8 TaxID=3112957 RepID=UPI00345D2F6C